MEVCRTSTVCVDLIGIYTIKSKDGTSLDFMCLAMVDPVTGWFKSVNFQIPTPCMLKMENK